MAPATYLGAEGVQLGLAQLLADQLPARTAQLLADYDALELPRIDRELLTIEARNVFGYQRLDLEVGRWPAVVVHVAQLVARTGGDRTVEGLDRWRSRYRARVYVFARGADEEEADRATRRLTAAVNLVLLEHPAWSAAIGDAAIAGVLRPESMREDYAELERTTAGTAGASFVELEVDVEEQLNTPTTPASATAVTVHPALA